MLPVGREVAAVFVDAAVKPLARQERVIAAIPSDDRDLIRRTAAEDDRPIGFAGENRVNSCGNRFQTPHHHLPYFVRAICELSYFFFRTSSSIMSATITAAANPACSL